MSYQDPYLAPDGPITRLAAKMTGYNGTLPSSIFSPRARWKTGRTAAASTPSTHYLVYEGEAIEISSDADFNRAKHNGGKLNINIKLGQTLFAEDVGYPHMQSGCKRDQRHLSIYHDAPIALSLLESLVGRPVRDLIAMPAWLDEIIGWRTILKVSNADPVVIVIDHQQWEENNQNSGKQGITNA